MYTVTNNVGQDHMLTIGNVNQTFMDLYIGVWTFL